MIGRLLLKPGARIETLAPAGVRILEALKAAARQLETEITITSGTDGLHKGPDDPHYSGEAFDVRTKTLTRDQKIALLREVMIQLQRGDMDAPIETSAGLATAHFFGFLEDPGGPNEHLHIQRRNGTTYTLGDYLSA